MDQEKKRSTEDQSNSIPDSLIVDEQYKDKEARKILQTLGLVDKKAKKTDESSGTR